MLTKEIAAISPLLAERGLQPSPGTGLVRWTGTLRGRTAEVSLVPVGRTRYVGDVRLRQRIGSRLEVALSTTLAVKSVLVPDATARRVWMRQLWRWKSMHLLAAMPAGLSDMRLVAHDAAWGQRLLADPPALAALTSLQEVAATAGSGTVWFVPGRVSQLSPVLADVADLPQRVDAALTGLDALASAAEALPPPATPATTGPFVRWFSANPLAGVLVGFVVVLGVFAVLGLLMLLLFLGAYSVLT